MVSHKVEKVCGIKSLLILKTDSYYFSDTLLEISKHSHAVERGLLFHLCERIIKEVISRNVKKKEIATKETLPISKEEEQILYYASGYITFSMIEKCKRIISNYEKNIHKMP